MPKFKSGGKIHIGEHPAEFYKALIGAEKDALQQAPSSTEGHQSTWAAGTHHSSTAPTVVPPHRGDHRRAPIATSSHHAEQQADVGATSGLGYALLAKSGWKGGGLGRAEQGITSPLPAWHNQGRMGIGSGAKRDPAASSVGASRQQRVTKASQPLGAEEVATGGMGRPQAHSSQRPQQSQRPPKPPKREWASVSVEEPMEAKVARVKQVLQAEADGAAERAFSRSFYRAFSDAGGYGSTDSNPLLRPSKLSKSNPLL